MHFNGWPRQQLEAAPLDAARRTDPRRPDRSWLTARATHLRPFRTTRVHGNVGHRRLGPPMVLATQEANRDLAPMSVSALRYVSARPRVRPYAAPPSTAPTSPSRAPMMAMVIAPVLDPPDDGAGAAVSGVAVTVGALGAPVDAVAPAAVSVSTGAGCSGSGPPGAVASIHLTTDPSE